MQQFPETDNDQTVPLSNIATRDVVTLTKGETLGTAARIMAEQRISSVLILNDAGQPVGIVTERNIVQAMQAGNPHQESIVKIMSLPVVSVPEAMDSQQAYLLCLKQGIRHLALIDGNGRLTGVVSETDFRLHMNLSTLTGRRLVASVMSRSVLSLPPDASLQQAVELMEEHRDGCVVVVKGKRPVGIVTERDIVRMYADMADAPTPKLSAVATTRLHTIMLDASVNEAASRMLEVKTRHLVVVDQVGNLAGLTTEHDLTQAMVRGLVDARLDAERTFLRGLIDAIPDLVWLKDPDGVFLACNPPFERLYGQPETGIVGKTDYDFVDRKSADLFREHDREAMARNGPSINEEWLTFAEDGYRGLFETIKTPMRDGQGRLIGVLAIGRDISAIRQVQEALKDSEANLRTLIEAMPDSVQFKDNEGRWLVYNQAAAKIFDLKDIDCQGRNDAELAEIANPHSRQALLNCWQTDRATLKSKKVARVVETIPQVDGDNLYFDIIKQPITLADGTTKGLVILARDVTESRRTTLALQQSLHDFNDLVTRIPVGVFKAATTPDGQLRFDYVSPRWCEMMGLTAEAVYQDVEEAFKRTHPEDLAGLMLAIETAIARGTIFDWEGRLVNNEETRWLHISATPTPLENGEVRWDGTQYDVTERRQIEQRLAMVSFALDHINDAAYLADEAGYFQYVNDEACRVLGHSRDELLRLHISDVGSLSSQEDWPATWRLIKRNGMQIFETLHKDRHGHTFPVEIRANFFEYLGRPYVLGLVHDISERKKTEEGLRLAASVFTSTHEGIVITDAENRIVETNEAFSSITGYSRKEVLGKNPGLLKSGHQTREFYREMWRTLEDKGHWSGEVWNRRKDGAVYAELLTISAVRDQQGTVTHYVGVFADITALKEHERRLERIAHYDALTGVPNRVLLADRANQAIAQTLRKKTLMAVCYLDLDGFKPINDSYGHEVGDLLLVEMARRMKECVRGGDTVARIGGDEFVLLLLGLNRMEECEAALGRLLKSIAHPATIDGQELSVSASIGVTLFPEDDSDADTLLRHADQAMYKAKESGKNRYHLFNSARDRQVKAHHDSLQRMGEALERNEFILHYQPKVNMSTGELLGLEALIRWRHPEHGILPPGEFLPTVKGTELEIALGEWVLDTALSQIETWRQTDLQVTVSVNISADHLLQPDFPERLNTILQRHPSVDPNSLELEILESTAIADIDRASQTLAECRRLGVHFSLDDFGTGYSSLTYFRRLPIDTLKIDQSFVRDMLQDPEDIGIVESVLQLATAFNRSVIAEGVETEEHCAMLSRLNCHVGQGFGIAQPMEPEQVLEWTTRWKSERKWHCISEVSMPQQRRDLVLKSAIESHLKWVEDVAKHLADPAGSDSPPLLDGECRFGLWYYGSGTVHYGHLPEFTALGPVHRNIHALAEELVASAAKGHGAAALARLNELYVLRDNFVTRLEGLIDMVQDI